MSQATQNAPPPLLTRRQLLQYPLWFAAGLLLAWGIAQGAYRIGQWTGTPVDVTSKWWPLSCFCLKIPGMYVPLLDGWRAAGVLVVFFIFVRWFSGRAAASVLLVVIAAFLLVLGTNLIHGTHYGLVHPHLADRQDPSAAVHQYYGDAVQVTSAWQFLRGFEEAQPQLGCHSRTHPPGAVLLIYGLWKVVGGPAAVSVIITALSVGLSGVFLYRLLAYEVDPETGGYVTLLLFMIPAVQIYYCATLDAVIAGCFLGVLLFLRHPRPLPSVVGMIAWLFCSSLLTFAACFLVPVVVGFEILSQRTVRRSAATMAGVVALHVLVYVLSGFNYLASFRTASALENPAGFMLWAEPVSYLVTRLENVADILLFLGPFLLAILLRSLNLMRRTWKLPQFSRSENGTVPFRTREVIPVRVLSVMRRSGHRPELFALTALGILTLLAMFLTGAFRTGETARACLFIYPFFMFPVATYLHVRGCRDADKRLLLWLVFGQSWAMQTLGGYYW